jgi:hypothetical protein
MICIRCIEVLPKLRLVRPKMKLWNWMLLIVGITLVSGCAKVSRTESDDKVSRSVAESDDRVIDRNYELGKERSAYVGEAVVRVKDYRVRTATTTTTWDKDRVVARASNDFSVRFPPFGPTVKVRAEDIIGIRGTMERDGKTYSLVLLPGAPSGVALLVDSNGRFEGSGVSGRLGNAPMGYEYKINPPNTTLRTEREKDSGTKTEKTHAGPLSVNLNFEILYSGVTKDSLRLLYREYTAGDLARPAFTQDLVYARDATTVRFRQILIRVIDSNSERIRYIVKEDGLSK